MSLNRKPRDKAEALAWLKQLASNLRDIQKEQLKAFRPVAKMRATPSRNGSRRLG